MDIHIDIDAVAIAFLRHLSLPFGGPLAYARTAAVVSGVTLAVMSGGSAALITMALVASITMLWLARPGPRGGPLSPYAPAFRMLKLLIALAAVPLGVIDALVTGNVGGNAICIIAVFALTTGMAATTLDA